MSAYEDLIEDELLNRPDKDELAFLHYEKIFRSRLDGELAKLQSTDEDQYWTSHNHFMQTYINNVISTVAALNLDVLETWVERPFDAANPDNFQRLKYDIDSLVIGIKIRHSQIARKASVRLDADTRSKIRDYISKIKTTIESIEIPLERKEKLLNRLNEFSAEVDRDRAKYEAIGALLIESASITGKVEAKLRPIRKWLDSIAGLMRAANGMEESRSQLPAPPKRIPGPPKRSEPTSAPPAKRKTPPLDDDIPF